MLRVAAGKLNLSKIQVFPASNETKLGKPSHMGKPKRSTFTILQNRLDMSLILRFACNILVLILQYYAARITQMKSNLKKVIIPAKFCLIQ